MVAKWAFVNPTTLLPPATKGGVMIMAVAAGKHVTVFRRSRTAKGAGDPGIKARFAEAARGTKGISSRSERNLIVSRAMGGKRS